MPENEFEKQVKELMEELRFSPSAPVWEKIKKSIGEKRRRWPVFFLFITVATLGGYFFYNDTNFNKQSASKNDKTVTQIPSAKNSFNDTNTQKNSNSIVETRPQQKTITQQIKTKTALTPINNFTKNKPGLDQQPLIKKEKIGNIANSAVTKNSVAIIPLTKTNNGSDVDKNNTTAQQHVDSTLAFTNTNNQDNVDTLSKNDNDLEKINTDTSTKNNNEDVKNNTSTDEKNKDFKIKKSSKWQWGISAMYGRSNITDNFINANTNKSASLNVNMGAPFIPGSNASNDPYYTDNAYNFGVTVQRQISKHSFLTSGLNFVHLSSKSNAARSLDSVLIVVAPNFQTSNIASSFYRIGSAKRYVNSFNFIELPIAFESNLFHVKNFAVMYNAGASVMQMVSSKSLLYNSANNSFFSSDDLLRRTQFQLTVGLNFQLSTKNSGKFLLGPHLAYSLSSYQKNSTDNLHFINYGLRATWLFNKK